MKLRKRKYKEEKVFFSSFLNRRDRMGYKARLPGHARLLTPEQEGTHERAALEKARTTKRRKGPKHRLARKEACKSYQIKGDIFFGWCIV